MSNTRCTRCGGIAYKTMKQASLPPVMREDGADTPLMVVEELSLCAVCRGKADKENQAAQTRRHGRDRAE